MKRPVFGLKLGLCALAIGFSGLAQAVCEIPGTTNATSVQEDSGNGTYNCSQHFTLAGDLDDVTHLVNVPPAGTRDGTITWSLKPTTADGKILEIRLVSVASNSGKRCIYSYSDLSNGGSGLTTTAGSTDTSGKTVTVCAVDSTGVDAPPPPPPEPISTVGNACTAPVTYTPPGETSPTTTTFDVAIGYSKQFDNGLNEGAAICAAQTGQQQCINECVVPANYDENRVCPADEFGRVALDCAACEYKKEPTSGLNYCWYYENQVCDGTDPEPEYCLNNGTPVKPNSFKPSPKKKSLSANIDVSTGSNCYTVTVGPMYGGRTYSYWYCPQ